MKSLDLLPDDPAALKRIIAQRDAQIDSLVEELANFKEQLLQALRREFGRSSEAAPGQGDLFNEAEVEADDPAVDRIESEGSAVAGALRTESRGGRKPLPAHLPRVEIVHEIDADERICPTDGSELVEIGEECREELDIVPAKVRVLRHVRKKYACRTCDSHVVRAEAPKALIPKGTASPGLLSQIVMYKYQDALPLYRQEAIFQRLGVEISRTTQANWMIRVGEALAPLLALMRSDLLTEPIVHSDETTVQVLKEAGRRPDQKSYMWVTVTGTGPPIVLYHYAPSRSRAVVEELLGGYQGTLVTDGYAAYDAVDARHAGCWAHARRKFHDAIKAQSGKRTGKGQIGFNRIQKVFAFEKRWAGLQPDQRLAERQQHAVPLIDALRQWLDTSLPQVSPKTLTGRALAYLDSQWDKLVVFLDDGQVPIHNNLAENKIRPFVIGRKNWLFSNSVAGANASAAIYSLIETIKANDLDPSLYLTWLFNELPNTPAENEDALRALLPYRVDHDRIVEHLANIGKHPPADY